MCVAEMHTLPFKLCTVESVLSGHPGDWKSVSALDRFLLGQISIIVRAARGQKQSGCIRQVAVLNGLLQ